jgi:putative holliday junction resolvase
MKLMGIDYGRRRIGVAMTDDTSGYIRGCATIDRKNDPDIPPALLDLVRRENPDGIVLGLPFDIDGHDTPMSIHVRSFAQKLAKVVTIPIHYIDESLTSKNAAELLRYRKKKERRDKASVDRIAACLILQEYLKEQGIVS